MRCHPSDRLRTHRPPRREARALALLLVGYGGHDANLKVDAVHTVNQMGVVDARQTLESALGIILGLLDGAGIDLAEWCDEFVATVDDNDPPPIFEEGGL